MTSRAVKRSVCLVSGLLALGGAACALSGCGSDAAPSAPTAGAGGAAANLNPTSIAPRTLQQVADHAAWTSTQVLAMAASASSVYLASSDEVDQFDGSALTPYLTVQEAADSAGLSVAAGFRALDIDAKGTLYSILSSTVIRSQHTHQAAVWRTDPSLAVQLGVAGVDDVVLISMQSMFRVMPHCASRLFTNGEFLGLDCGAAQLTVAHSGSFLYAADCGVNQLYRGTIDGASFDVIYSAGSPATPPLNATQFVCSTRDPAGGFYLVVDDGNAWQLLHLSDYPSGTTGLDSVVVSPTFAEARDATPSLGRPLPFTTCKLAAKADGTLFLQTASLLFELTVTP